MCPRAPPRSGDEAFGDRTAVKTFDTDSVMRAARLEGLLVKGDRALDGGPVAGYSAAARSFRSPTFRSPFHLGWPCLPCRAVLKAHCVPDIRGRLVAVDEGHRGRARDPDRDAGLR